MVSNTVQLHESTCWKPQKSHLLLVERIVSYFFSGKNGLTRTGWAGWAAGAGFFAGDAVGKRAEAWQTDRDEEIEHIKPTRNSDFATIESKPRTQRGFLTCVCGVQNHPSWISEIRLMSLLKPNPRAAPQALCRSQVGDVWWELWLTAEKRCFTHWPLESFEDQPSWTPGESNRSIGKSLYAAKGRGL